MKTTRYTLSALRDLRTHPAAALIRQAFEHNAAADTPRAGQVTRLEHSPANRLRLGGDRLIFEARETELVVTKIGRRGDTHV